MKPKAYSYIRFSSAEQAKGHSLERQTQKTLAYAKKHGLALDTGLRLKDLGISAYTGANVKKGGLGAFLRAVENGLVAAGSFLIVESFDRMGRTTPMEQFTVFSEIINAGITVVTLTDEKSYSSESLAANPMDLFGSLMIMSRAHEESKTKGMRVSAAYAKKRETGTFITSLCPGWIRADKATKTFHLIPERAALVLRIYKMADSGLGKALIAKTFNEEGIKSWGGADGWYPSYIQKILENRGVMGEYQPHIKREGVRKPVGKPLPNYFPPAVPEELFYRVLKKRRVNATFTGKVDDRISNLFSGVAKSGYLGDSMVYVNKGDNLRYLVPSNATRGQRGKYVSWAYEDFETSFLTFIKNLDFSTVYGAKENKKLAAINLNIAKKTEVIAATKESIQRLIKFITSSDNPPLSISEEIKKLEDQQKADTEALKLLKADLDEEISQAESVENRGENLKALAKAKKADLVTRARLRDEIKDKIQKIEMYSAGGDWSALLQTPEKQKLFFSLMAAIEKSFLVKKPMHQRIMKAQLSKIVEWTKKPSAVFPYRENPDPKKNRFFIVHFKNEKKVIIRPDFKDPAELVGGVGIEPKVLGLDRGVRYSECTEEEEDALNTVRGLIWTGLAMAL